MKYAPVVPPSCIEQLRGVKVRAYFCFADSAFYDEEYRRFFTEGPAKDQYIVLDCPIVEHGKIIDPEQYAQVVRAIKPTMAIIPDVQFQRMPTLAMFKEYLAACPSAYRERLAGVPQGTTKMEIVWCAQEMYDAGIRRMGIIRTRNIAGKPRRSDIIRTLAYSDVKYHLLGAEFPYIDEGWCSENHLADSCDSAEPINAAIRGMNMVTSRKDLARFKRPEGFMKVGYIDQHQLRTNIQRMQKWLNATLKA